MPVFQKAQLNKETSDQFLKAGVRYFIDTNVRDVYQQNDYGGVTDTFLNYFWDSGEVVEHLPEGKGIEDDSYISLAKVFPEDEWGQILNSGRGHVMISFIPKEDRTIPRSLGMHVGFFYVLPDNMGLASAQRKLYGDIYDTPEGFWEHMGRSNPALLSNMISAAQFTRDLTGNIITNTDKIAKSVLMAGGAIVAVMVVFKLLKK